MENQVKQKVSEAISWTGAILYFPFYFIGWLLHKIARFVLVIAYILMLEPQKSQDIITNFMRNGRRF